MILCLLPFWQKHIAFIFLDHVFYLPFVYFVSFFLVSRRGSARGFARAARVAGRSRAPPGHAAGQPGRRLAAGAPDVTGRQQRGPGCRYDLGCVGHPTAIGKTGHDECNCFFVFIYFVLNFDTGN